MARATVMLALVAMALLVTGSAAARLVPADKEGRRLLQTGNASATGTSSGSGDLSFGNSFNTAFAGPGYSAAGGASFNAGVQPNGQISFSDSIGTGTSLSINGVSNSQANVQSQANGVPGSASSETINVGSSDGGAASDALASAGTQSGRR